MTIGKDLWEEIQNPARAICEPKRDAYVLADMVIQPLTDSPTTSSGIREPNEISREVYGWRSQRLCSLAQRCGESSRVRMISPVNCYTRIS
jgi:hypothetical protein